MLKLSRADQLKLEAGKKRGKFIPVKTVSVDFYDTDILGKTSQKSRVDENKVKQEIRKIDDEQKPELEFHEQFFS